ncbi:hypothetical protein CYMTET_47934 [Cymbomonas tetramitiformis]|uniref:Protein kinase domain-containing protein n=1 Tax=Cymbomonas tetramitiformis TaxID=36881 RepID=A0AAE0BV73_9CHLO|nr:hypothetical protein CYMTET_47934 [Cymbomonas tetramitiformis]
MMALARRCKYEGMAGGGREWVELERAQGGERETTPRALRVKLLTDAALGMSHLHSKNVVHLDLKCQNLLVTGSKKNPRCKVADFGLSVQRQNNRRSLSTMKEMVGTPCFMAPEMVNFEGAKVDERVDVFSFGMVMWEALTARTPFEDWMDVPFSQIRIPIEMKENNLRPEVPSSCETDYRQLMEECWDGNKVKRPDFPEIAARLETMKQ